MRPSLRIAGREISIIGWLNFDQKIEPVSASTTRRRADGSAYRLTRWKKHRITLSGSGWIPVPLLGIDYDQPIVIELPKPIALIAGDVLPAGLVARAAPFEEGPLIDQAGNTIRQVYVKATIFADPPSDSNDGDGNWSWELTGETL